MKLFEDGSPLPDKPNVYAIIEQPHFEILDTWNVSGLCGSGSHDVKVDDVLVPEEHIVAPMGGFNHPCALLRIPLGSRLAYNKVGVSLGIARNAINAFVDIAEGKVPRFTSHTLRERPHAQHAVAAAEIRLRSARAVVFELVEEMWEAVCARAHITTRQRALFQLACSDAVKGSAEAVALVTEAAGTTANRRDHPLERPARDIRVVAQHVTVAAHQMDDAGRVLLGLKPTGMMLAGLARAED